MESEGLIQRFEYCWELAWKTIKDYLDSEGIIISIATPKAVLREAFAVGFITDGDIWMEALDDRNKMSHVYSAEEFNKVIGKIKDKYLSLFEYLYEKLLSETIDGK